MPRKLNLKRPVFVNGQEATVVWIGRRGIFAVELPGAAALRQFDPYGGPVDGNHNGRAVNEEPETSEIVVVYPHGDIYTSSRPYQTSMYGVDQLIQIRVTKRGGRIVRKELLP